MTYLALDDQNQDQYPRWVVPGKNKELTYSRSKSMWTIRWVGGGELPEVLQSQFTSEKLVSQAIENYVLGLQDVKSSVPQEQEVSSSSTNQILPIEDRSKSVGRKTPKKRKLTPRE